MAARRAASPDARRRRTAVDPARQTAYDVAARGRRPRRLRATSRSRDCCASAGSTGRDAAFATELAHGTAAPAGQLRRDPRAAARPAACDARARGARRAPARHPPAAAHAGAVARGGRHDGRPGPGRRSGERPVRLVNAVLRRVGASGPRRVAGRGRARRATPTSSATSRCGTRTRAGSSTAFRDAARRARPRSTALLAADNVAPRVTLVGRPGLATVDELVAAGAEPGRWSPYAGVLDGRRPGRDRRRSRRAAPGCRTRARQLVALALAAATLDGSRRALARPVRRPGRQGRPARRPGARARRGAGRRRAAAAPRRPGAVGAAWPTGRPATRGRGDGTQPAVAAGRRSTGCSSTPRAPGSARCAAGRRPAGGARRTTSRRSSPLQRDLLGAALDAARPGGVVAYVTCSPHLRRDPRCGRRRARAARGRRRGATRATAAAGSARPGRRARRPALAAPARHRRDVPGAAAPALTAPPA